jgi:glycosyltransferase involved in cell wall biosynthesis
MRDDAGKIRLAFLTGYLKSGGAELQMIALARRLTRRGFEVDFVLRGGPGPLDGAARAAGASVRSIGALTAPATSTRARVSLGLDRNLRWLQLARRERYDIVDAWLYPADVVAALSRHLTRTLVVTSARLDLLPRVQAGPATRSLESAVNRLTDVVVANADVTAAYAVDQQRVPRDKVRVIRGGVELPRVFDSTERRSQRAALGASDEDFLIGCVGTLRTLKRQDLLIDAVGRLLPHHDKLRLVLVGDGYNRERIERHVERSGLGDRVLLTGNVSDLPPLYDAFDLFVQASNNEGLPNVLLEAGASSLPIVATAAGGTGEVIKDGETGLLVPIDDLDALTAAMSRAISDAGLRARLASGARALIEREYGMDRFAEEYAQLYEAQLAAKRGMGPAHASG